MDIPDKKFTPTFDRVVIKAHKVTETKGGLTIPDSAKSDSYRTPTATVVCVGPDCKMVKRGHVVLVAGTTQGIKVYYDDDQLMAVYEKDIIAILD
jgi:co-chaperonin GroES (HSP10)